MAGFIDIWTPPLAAFKVLDHLGHIVDNNFTQSFLGYEHYIKDIYEQYEHSYEHLNYVSEKNSRNYWEWHPSEIISIGLMAKRF